MMPRFQNIDLKVFLSNPCPALQYYPTGLSAKKAKKNILYIDSAIITVIKDY